MAAALADERSNPLSVKEISDQLKGYAVCRFSIEFFILPRGKGDILNFFPKRPARSECYFSLDFVGRPTRFFIKECRSIRASGHAFATLGAKL